LFGGGIKSCVEDVTVLSAERRFVPDGGDGFDLFELRYSPEQSGRIELEIIVTFLALINAPDFVFQPADSGCPRLFDKRPCFVNLFRFLLLLALR
jgi:hypothetical protein